jgi:PmbA protein
MIRSIDNGIYIVNTLGAGQSNVIAGDLSFTVDLGYRIENGKITAGEGRYGSGNVFDWMNNVIAVENKLKKMGGMDAPHLLIDKVSCRVKL